VWGTTAAIVVLDAVVATPLGLPWLFLGPVALAAFSFRRREMALLGLVCASSSFLFGPLGDPLGLHAVTLEVPGSLQLLVGALTALGGWVGVGLLLHRLASQSRTIRALTSEAQRDPLTGLANRRVLDHALAELSGAPGAVVAVDLDHFKRVNDTWGHAAGDAVLTELGRRLRRVTRLTDVVARTGGEEFVLVLPSATPDVARRVAQDVWSAVRDTPFLAAGQSLHVTASVGAASGPLSPTLVEQADAAAYASKQGGRDRVTLAS
jgi:diguanylate cyclase (GGDEF)-like protein